MNPKSKDSYGVKYEKNTQALDKTSLGLNINSATGQLFISSLYPLLAAVLSNNIFSLSSISSPVQEATGNLSNFQSKCKMSCLKISYSLVEMYSYQVI